MRGLPTLIRVHKWQLEECRRRLGELEATEERWLSLIARLDEEVRLEQEIATADIEAGFAYGPYAQASIERRYQMEGELETVRQQIRDAMEEVISAYQELKKYEVALANRQKREAEERNHREQVRLDDIGLEGFRRRAGSLFLK